MSPTNPGGRPLAGNAVGGSSGLSSLSEGVSESSSTTPMSSPPSTGGNSGRIKKLLSSPGGNVGGDGEKGVGRRSGDEAEIVEKGAITVASNMGNGPKAALGNGLRPGNHCTSKSEYGNAPAPVYGGAVVDRCGAEKERRQKDRQSQAGRREGRYWRQSGSSVEEECEGDMRDGENSNSNSNSMSATLAAAAAAAVVRSPFVVGCHSASPGVATTVHRKRIPGVEGGQPLDESGDGERDGSDLDLVGGSEKGRDRSGLDAIEGWGCGHRGMNGEDDCPFRRPDFVVTMCLTLYKVRVK